jgi:GNAT superfamily N-acetyltransferase
MDTPRDLTIIEFIDDLPAGLPLLADKAREEGYRHLERLMTDWNSGEMRFSRPGEALLAAFLADEIVGVGGLTVEPKLQNALRMRRFYVLPQYRGQSIGRRLAETLIHNATGSASALTLNAGDDSAASFWERLGFARIDGDGFTHVLRLNRD